MQNRYAVDAFDFPSRLLKDGWDYTWIRNSRQSKLEYREDGWKPARIKDFRSRRGMILYKRPLLHVS